MSYNLPPGATTVGLFVFPFKFPLTPALLKYDMSPSTSTEPTEMVLKPVLNELTVLL